MAAWVDAWADARGGLQLSQDGHEMQSGGHTAEADDPCGRHCHLDSVMSSHGDQPKTPEIPTDIRAPGAKKRESSRLCLAQGTAVPNKLGPVGEGREDRHPAKTPGPPPLPLTGIRAQPCHWNSAVHGPPCPCGPGSFLRKDSPSAEWERIVTTDQRHTP